MSDFLMSDLLAYGSFAGFTYLNVLSFKLAIIHQQISHWL
jgi:hypothetical protein